MAGLNKLQLQVFGRRMNKYLDLRNLGITRQFGLFKTSETKYEKCGIIGKLDSSAFYIVYFDDNGEVSDNSPVESGGIISGTIGTIKGSDDWAWTAFICHITEVVIPFNNTSLGISGARLLLGGDFIFDPVNGKKCLYITGNRGFHNQGLGALPELNNTENWSIYSASNPDLATDIYYINSTVRLGTTTTFIDISIDRRVNRIGNNIVTTSGAYTNNFSSTLTTDEQKRLLTTFNGSSKNIAMFLNNNLEQEQIIDGNYTNNCFRICGQHNTVTKPFKGYWHFQTVHNRELNLTERNKLENNINTYFNI